MDGGKVLDLPGVANAAATSVDVTWVAGGGATAARTMGSGLRASGTAATKERAANASRDSRRFRIERV